MCYFMVSPEPDRYRLTEIGCPKDEVHFIKFGDYREGGEYDRLRQYLTNNPCCKRRDIQRFEVI